MQIALEHIDAVIFDMDGLLLDTEKIALTAFVSTCRAYGIDPDVDIYVRCIGTNSARTREILTEGFGEDFPYEAIRERWSGRYEEIISSEPIPRKQGAAELLAFLAGRSTPVGLATSTRYASAVRKLERTELLAYFDIIVGGDQVVRGKPDPEIYLTVSRRLGLTPGRCLALEDSDNGVLAAHGAGMPVIQIPDLRQPSPQVASLGHPVLGSLEDVRSLFEGMTAQ